jgi:glycosyltransferase involved in cell wall biosynthesis
MKSDSRTPRTGAIAAAGEHTRRIGGARASGQPEFPTAPEAAKIVVALLTGGGDRPYAYGLATELVAKGIDFDLIGSDELDFPELHNLPGVRFLNLRGSQKSDASFKNKTSRVLAYYFKLIQYAFHSKPGLFHILWNNKFEAFDRTLLMVYYRLLRKRIVLTVHNVNAQKRDSKDSFFNRFTLRIQYRLADHLFVHSDRMKTDLMRDFGVPNMRITTIPFGLNNSVPNSDLTPEEARRRLGVPAREKVILFFGNVAPYKGLEYLVNAFRELPLEHGYRLIIAGRPKGFPEYWMKIQEAVDDDVRKGRVVLRPDYIPDEETEVYFKAADVLVLPYRYIYQSGVLFLGYSFGLPVLAADVGSLKEEIVEGETGYVFKPEDPVDLAKAIETYFGSNLYTNLAAKRTEIRDYALAQHSWDVVGERTREVYAALQGWTSPVGRVHREVSNAS